MPPGPGLPSAPVCRQAPNTARPSSAVRPRSVIGREQYHNEQLNPEQLCEHSDVSGVMSCRRVGTKR